MRSFLIVAALSVCAPAAALAQDAPAPAATAAAVASPTPRAVSRADAAGSPAAHFVAKGRKIGSPFGYMKQASDDPQGLSRIQDQARQLRPQL